MAELRYSQAIELEWKLNGLLQELSDFVDAEEDAIEAGADPDPDYIDALSEAAVLLDRACVQMARVDD